MLAQSATYRLCPACGRAVPSHADEKYCINDGNELLVACTKCGHAVTSPYARYCPNCGNPYGPSGT